MADEDVVITPYRDGPLLVRGPFRMQDQNGNEIDVGRRTVALCRCGKSRIRPFCDGTHALVRFRAPSEPERGRAPGSAARPGADRFGRDAEPSDAAPGRGPGRFARGSGAPDQDEVDSSTRDTAA